jgi:hypothetical protein
MRRQTDGFGTVRTGLRRVPSWSPRSPTHSSPGSNEVLGFIFAELFGRLLKE